MKAKELASYFSKKVAKPITYTVDEITERTGPAPERTYSIEPTAIQTTTCFTL